MLKPKVLILDDEPEIGSLLKLFLEDDFEISISVDPRLACEEIEHQNYDLVVSDIKMPFMSGLDVVRHTKRTSPSTEIVLITGHMQSAEDKQHATDLGAAGILSKPFGDPVKIISYLRSVISNGRAQRLTAGKILKPKILVLDDEVDLVDVVMMLLGDDYIVETFTNPVEAIAAAKTGDFQCFITDLNMPQMRGRDVVASLKRIAPSVPILVMSGHSADDFEVQEALILGASGIVSKPFPEPHELLSLIGKYIK